MEIFDKFGDAGQGLEFLLRYGHILSGITWIGLLYFFNFVQVPMYAKLSDGARSEALRNVTLRALWWFRYAALATFLFGVAIVSIQDQEQYFKGARGASILTGMLFGITMFLNVWGIIWRNNKRVIASAQSVADGGAADPDVPKLAKAAGRASRTNTLFSIPMLFFMVFTAHFGTIFNDNQVKNLAIYWIVVLLLWAFVEASALGFIGGFDSPFNKLAMDDHRRTIWAGFILLLVLYIVGWELILGA